MIPLVKVLCGSQKLAIKKFHFKRIIESHRRLLSNFSKRDEEDASKIRNIGIIAHIDAGKTTTTERMLYYSGFTHAMGEVHDGDTVMDYMAQERQRGITITSAAVTFNWKKHKINLIDTPGHVDFTIEVERSLCVLDGGIVILDASAGVEVQTLTVWNQANHHQVPCIVYLNKMDKPAADFRMSLDSLQNKMKVKTLVIQLPLGTGKSFNGVVDLVSMKKLVWNRAGVTKDGKTFSLEVIQSNKDQELWTLASKKREELIENVADLDDHIANKFILDGSQSISETDLLSAIRRITLKRTAVPVLCGSAYKNIAVQPLMDAVLYFLPNPDERLDQVFAKEDELYALVFKIVHDKRRGPLTFLRLYSGSLKNGQKLYNLNRKHYEKITNLMIPLADDFRDVSSISYGNIVVVTGLKEAFTGDTLSSKPNLFKEKSLSTIIQVPDPVFFCTIEPPSPGLQKQLEYALQCLKREDPTFCVEHDEELGQIVISGMGELHIDVIKEKIRTEFGVDAYLGPLQVAYREALCEKITDTYVLEKNLNNTKHFVKITLGLNPSLGSGKFKNIKVIVTKENNLGNVRPDYIKALNEGISSSLMHGPLLGFPVIDITANLLWLEIGKGTAQSMITAAAFQCIQHVMKKSVVQLLEPVMRLFISVASGHTGRILSDLSQKRAQILNMEALGDVETILCRCPLSELMGYSTTLRAITSGNCVFTLEFDSYEKMDKNELSKAIEQVTGFVPSL